MYNIYTLCKFAKKLVVLYRWSSMYYYFFNIVIFVPDIEYCFRVCQQSESIHRTSARHSKSKHISKIKQQKYCSKLNVSSINVKFNTMFLLFLSFKFSLYYGIEKCYFPKLLLLLLNLKSQKIIKKKSRLLN